MPSNLEEDEEQYHQNHSVHRTTAISESVSYSFSHQEELQYDDMSGKEIVTLKVEAGYFIMVRIVVRCSKMHDGSYNQASHPLATWF